MVTNSIIINQKYLEFLMERINLENPIFSKMLNENSRSNYKSKDTDKLNKLYKITLNFL